MFDIVEAHRTPSGDMPAPLKELAVARLPYRSDRVLGDDRVQGEGVVGIQPVRELIFVVRKFAGIGLGAGSREFGNDLIEQRAMLDETRVVHLAVGGDNLRQKAAPVAVVHGV